MRFEICAFGTKSARRWPLTVFTSDTLVGCRIKIIPKVPVGVRPIGVFCAPYRVRAKARRPIANEWEKRNARPYFAAGSFTGAGGAVWRQLLRAEGEVARDHTSANLLWDFVKYYETLPLGQLQQRCHQHDFPLAASRVAIAVYASARHVCLQAMISEAVFARFGVVAGCSMATTMIRINSMGPLDKIAGSPHVDFKMYIDNSSIAAVGTRQEVASGVVEGARALQSATAEIGATLSADKAILICSSKA
eukprot:305588-Pyramimonas_sp.AAC.1